MNIYFDDLLWLLIFAVGVYFLRAGMRSMKDEKRDAGILSILMAVCAFLICTLHILVHTIMSEYARARMVSNVQLIICGVWLGVYIVMLILGHMKRLTRKRESQQAESDRSTTN